MNVPKLSLKRLESDRSEYGDVLYFGQSVSPPGELRHLSTWRYCKRYDVERMVGYATAGFYERCRRGELIPFTPWYQFQSTGSGHGSYDCSYNYSGNNIDRVWYTEGTDSDAWILTEEYLRTLVPFNTKSYVTEAAAKIYSEGWDALTFLAELSQVKGMFTHAAKALSKLSVPSNWRSLSSMWLEYRFGWRPFISDIRNIAKIVANHKPDEVKRHMGRAHGNINSHSTSPRAFQDFRFDYTRLITDQVSINPTGIVCADMVVPSIQINPLQTGWELIPFSFVVDWFLGVGRAISALSVISTSQRYVAASGIQIRVKRRESVEITARHIPPLVSVSWDHDGQCEAVLTMRTPCSIPIIPRPIVHFDASKVIDSLALIVQRLK